MAGWFQALARTRDKISGVLGRILGGGLADESSWEELEETLVMADLPARLAAEIVQKVRGAGRSARVARLRAELIAALGAGAPFAWASPAKPRIILVLGVNGSGKTTTCAKLAHLAREQGLKPLLGAADTFRAAGSEQLRIWGERIGCDAVGGQTGADAAAVAHDAVTAALARQSDVVIIDTAGRMHTREPLMQELQKTRNVLARRLPGAPHETWIVLDATMGQNAILQARAFHEAAPLTGAVVTKVDGSSKAGFVFGVARELNIPIRFMGLGEKAGDLAPFDPASFVDAVLGRDEARGAGNQNSEAGNQ